jgi:GNAT superfamily N-acetyltransferase
MDLVDGPHVDGAVAVDVWDYEMTDPASLRPAAAPRVEAVLLRAEVPAAELSRFFYGVVGGPWSWVDRRAWTIEQWTEWVSGPGHRLVTCWVDGAPAGYYELEAVDGEVELAYFGLVERCFGMGLGSWLLADAITTAWAIPGTRRVWLHTCSLDGPNARSNYERRGFVECGHRTEWRRPAVTPAR